ncbi:MAG: type VI secretion system protein TssL, short form, partial [Yersiniaceae bacterium]|nr:type VI secretion system protein TssL, short form [Yersiniaceae bacterium]
DEASIGHISYAQCALLDETVMSRKSPESEEDGSSQMDKGQAAWRKAPLQARFFSSLQAGEALWDRVAEVLRQTAPVDAVLTCYHRVIALGFQGLYSVQTVSRTQREEVIRELAGRVSLPDAGLSLVIHRMGKHRYSLLRSIWFWIVLSAVLTGAVWWGGHLWLQALLSAQIPELPR